MIELFAARIVGWRVCRSWHIYLVLDALEEARCARQTNPRLAHHSNRGSRYLSVRRTERLAEAGIDSQVGCVGSAYDYALAGTIIGLHETEVIDVRCPRRTLEVVEYATLEWVDWLNNRHLLESTGHLPPAEYERNHHWLTEAQVMAACVNYRAPWQSPGRFITASRPR